MAIKALQLDDDTVAENGGGGDTIIHTTKWWKTAIHTVSKQQSCSHILSS